MKTLALLLLAALFSGLVQAAYVKPDVSNIPPMHPTIAAPGQIIGFIVCKPIDGLYCLEWDGMTRKRWRFDEYVKKKTSPRAEIIGYQLNPEDDELYLFFTVPEEDIPPHLLPPEDE